MDTIILGRNIHKARRDLEISSDKLAELCEVTPSYLRQVEAGSKVPSLPFFVTLCNELRVSPSYLLAGVVDKAVDTSIEELNALCGKAKPSQIKLITAMLKTAIEHC